MRRRTSREPDAGEALSLLGSAGATLATAESLTGGLVAAALTGMAGIEVAESVTGPYDVVVRVRAASIDELGPLIAVQIAGVAGITRTVTCPVVHI